MKGGITGGGESGSETVNINQQKLANIQDPEYVKALKDFSENMQIPAWKSYFVLCGIYQRNIINKNRNILSSQYHQQPSRSTAATTAADT